MPSHPIRELPRQSALRTFEGYLLGSGIALPHNNDAGTMLLTEYVKTTQLVYYEIVPYFTLEVARRLPPPPPPPAETLTAEPTHAQCRRTRSADARAVQILIAATCNGRASQALKCVRTNPYSVLYLCARACLCAHQLLRISAPS